MIVVHVHFVCFQHGIKMGPNTVGLF